MGGGGRGAAYLPRSLGWHGAAFPLPPSILPARKENELAIVSAVSGALPLALCLQPKHNPHPGLFNLSVGHEAVLRAALGHKQPLRWAARATGMWLQLGHGAVPLPGSGLLHFLRQPKPLGSRELTQNPKAF